MKFRDLVEKTLEIGGQFPKKYDVRDHFMDLVEEVGELAQAMQISSGRKLTRDPAKRRDRGDVVDAVCDILFELIRLADKLNIDLEKEYPEVLEHIKGRIDRGEFVAD